MPSADRPSASWRTALLMLVVCLGSAVWLGATHADPARFADAATLRSLTHAATPLLARVDDNGLNTICVGRRQAPAGKTVCRKRHRGAPEQSTAPVLRIDNGPVIPLVAEAPAFAAWPEPRAVWLASPPLPSRAPPVSFASL